MEKHDLHHEFPEFEQKILELKVSNNHFKKIFDLYHDINNDIHRIETGAENTTDQVLTEFRLKRVLLKDELYKILSSI